MPTFSSPRRLRCRVAAAALLCVVATTAAAGSPGGADIVETPERTTAAVIADAALAPPLEVARVTSGFAMRRHPIKKHRHHHAGVDFAAPRGAPVRSVDAGVVAFAGVQSGYGNVVYIAHGMRDRTTVYAHLDRIDVHKGQQVRQGDTIGTVGRTGLATGHHLHFEVREGGKPIDPMSLVYAAVPMLASTAAATAMSAEGSASTDAPRCVDLLQKASLEPLATDEIDLLRQGCIR